MNMIDLEDITKDYFKKSIEEREELITQFFNEIHVLMVENELDFETIQEHFDKLINKSLRREDYEVTELFTKLKTKFQELENGL